MHPIFIPSRLLATAAPPPPWEHEMRGARTGEFEPLSRRRHAATELPDQPQSSPPLPSLPTGRGRDRLHGIDLLRGVVMVLMTLDHARDFFANAGSMNPRDVEQPALFLTRWVTHFCAPIFVLLAGVSAFLYGQRPGRTTRDVGRFLVKRGAWLVAIELTVVNFGWTFDVKFEFLTLQVIWAIGCSMIALGGLVFLPRKVFAAVAIVMIAGHNLLDGVRAEQLASFGWLWTILHEPGMLGAFGGREIFALYPLVPWIGVMAAGYALGPVMQLDGERRRQALVNLGVALVVLFIALRGTNLYGDPADLVVHDTLFGTLLSFLDCEKYPPSLLYLAMTLGPALIALALLDRASGTLARALMTFGRVPFLYYVAHVYLIHVLAVVLAMFSGGGEIGWLFGRMPLMNKPAGFGLSLPGVYVMWLTVVALLYPLCRWFAGVKRRRTDWWLSYL